MQYYLAAVTAFAAGILAAPTSLQERAAAATYSKSHPVIGSTCPAIKVTQPSNPLFPFANLLGSKVGPALRGLVGSTTVDEIE